MHCIISLIKYYYPMNNDEKSNRVNSAIDLLYICKYLYSGFHSDVKVCVANI